MPLYDLYAVGTGGSTFVDVIEANDADEAIVLTTIRLEQCDVELRYDGRPVASLSKEGRLRRDPDRLR